MSLWLCKEHGLYGPSGACPVCGVQGEYVRFAQPKEDPPMTTEEEIKSHLASEQYAEGTPAGSAFRLGLSLGNKMAQPALEARAAEIETLKALIVIKDNALLTMPKVSDTKIVRRSEWAAIQAELDTLNEMRIKARELAKESLELLSSL